MADVSGLGEHLQAAYRAEAARLDTDCAEAIFLTPDRLDRLHVVQMTGLHPSLPDRVGWVACLLDEPT